MTFSPNMRWVELQQRATTQDATYGTTVEGGWATVKTVKAEVQDILPSRAERVSNDVNMANRPARVRFRFRDGVTSAMRLNVKGRGPNEPDRVMRITSGPAELGFRDRAEVIAEEISTAGQEP